MNHVPQPDVSSATMRTGHHRRHRDGTGGSVPEAFDGLASDRGDEVEVLVDVQHGESGEFGGRRDEQVGDRRGAVLATVGEQPLDFDRSSFDRRREVLDGHR